MNPDEPGSPLARLRGSLTTMFEQHAKGQAEAMSAFEERQRKLEQDIREAVTRLEERKRGESTSARGGATFEDTVLTFVQRAVQGAPIVVDATGNSVGARPGCKVHAPSGFPVFARHGCDILATWDDADEGTDSYLHAGVLLGLALTTRHRRPQDAGNINALTDIEARIQSELTRHDKMRKMVRVTAEPRGPRGGAKWRAPGLVQSEEHQRARGASGRGVRASSRDDGRLFGGG